MTVTFTQQPRIVSQTSSSVTVDAVVESEGVVDPYDGAFVMEVEVIVAQSFTLPVTNGASNSGNIDWGDGSSNAFGANQHAGLTHTYTDAGAYIIQVTGTLTQIYFNNGANNRNDVRRVLNWGNNVISSLGNSFYGCASMTSVSSYATVGSISDVLRAFRNCSVLAECDLSGFDFSGSVNSGVMFSQPSARAGLVNFNAGDLNSMPLESAEGIFRYQSGYSLCDVSGWNTAACTNISYAFQSLPDDAVTGLASWNIAALLTGTNMLSGSKITTEEYDATLNSWEAQPHQSNVTAHFGTSVRTSASDDAFNALLADGWTITDSNGTSP